MWLRLHQVDFFLGSYEQHEEIRNENWQRSKLSFKGMTISKYSFSPISMDPFVYLILLLFFVTKEL